MADTDVQANAIFTALIAGEDFSVPAVDFDLPIYSVPDGTGDLYTPISSLTEADLTTRAVNGSGLFDGLMASVSAHVRKEYEEGRINAAEYTQAYIGITQAAMANAVQFALGKDNAYWQAQIAQKQAQAAEAQLVRARIDAEIAKAELSATRADAANRAATYAATKQSLALGEAQYDQVVYQTTSVLPKEVDRLQNQIDVGTAQISQITAQKDQVLYETANKIPAEVSNIAADTTIKGYTHTDVLPSQVALNAAETQLKAYDLSWIKPATLTSINEQMEAHRAKTKDTRREDGSPVNGTMKRQIDLHEQQIIAYQRDAEAKVGKMLIDTWVARSSISGIADAFTEIDDPAMGDLITKLRTSHGIA